MIFVTGGAGFIGSHFIKEWLKSSDEAVLNIDLLTYAGNLANLKTLENDSRYLFYQSDIADSVQIKQLLDQYSPRAVIHFAAESHVDKSIVGPEDFIQTNIVGSFRLLNTVLAYWQKLSVDAKNNFRFLHISSDEVYGSLNAAEPAFTEQSVYQPNSPYSASKAASDHLVRAYYHTYQLPVITTHCSNNYGPYQFPEKLIPLCIQKALQNQAIPVYGDGKNIRDWLYVSDHCHALIKVLAQGRVGQTYHIGGSNEQSNLDVVKTLCNLLDQLKPRADGKTYAQQISFVKDRAGHDFRYAVNADKIKRELGWYAKENFTSGLYKTVQWYLENQEWVENIASRP